MFLIEFHVIPLNSSLPRVHTPVPHQVTPVITTHILKAPPHLGRLMVILLLGPESGIIDRNGRPFLALVFF